MVCSPAVIPKLSETGNCLRFETGNTLDIPCFSGCQWSSGLFGCSVHMKTAGRGAHFCRTAPHDQAGGRCLQPHRVHFPCLLAGGEADVAIALPCKRFCLGVSEIWSPHSITTACVDFHIAVTLLPIAKMKRKYKKTRQNVVLITLSHTVPSSDDLFSSALWTTVLCLQRPKMKWALITFEG